MKLLFWIIGVPLLVIAAFFAVANREFVTVSLWPLAEPMDMPLFVAIVAPLYVGVLLGALAAWWSGRRARSRARAEARRADTLARENAELKQRLQTLEGQANPRTPLSPQPMAPALQSSAASPPTFAP
jgi:uncharacterized integral membrane protein